MDPRPPVIFDERYCGTISDTGLNLVLYGRNRFRPELVIEPHVHAYYDFTLITEGSALYTVDGRTYRLDVGDMCVTRPGEQHGMTGVEGCEWEIHFLAVDHIQPPELDQAFRRANPKFISSCADLAPDLERILSESRQSRFGWKNMVTLLTNAWLYEVARRLSAFDQPSSMTSRSETVESARVYIETYASYKLSLQEVAQHVGISKSRLVQRFSDEMQVAVCRYNRQVLMQRAIRMLEEGRLNVSQIADELGFPSIHYFSTSFKKHWGVPPTAYQRNLKTGSSLPSR